MEYFPHGTLHDYLKAVGSPMPEKEAREVTVQLLEGLVFMHAQNYAHRDLKPSVSIPLKFSMCAILNISPEYFHRLPIP